ncbi:hypothetical protein R5R35_002443 [Gryllus longicercus]|uniref:Small ribosomal subunit protein mS29 n=1 Tax=Gryllus longicercus TaxID=2509291 RepID=A0AAN9VFW6_9ORTH
MLTRYKFLLTVTRNNYFLRQLSLESPNVFAKPESRCRTVEDNPLNHNLEHEGRFYVVPPAVCNQLFRFGGIPKGYEVQAKTFDETCLMIRKPALEVINMMKVADYSRPIVKYVLFGERGAGKSLTLAHILHYALNSGHLIIHVPWVPDWMKKCKDHTRSETREGFRDTPLDSAAWLAHFKTQNQHLLSQTDLTVTSNYTWSKREETRSGSPLVELVDLGINRIKYASNIIVALASEVKALSSSGRCKTLVAIDGFNCFYNKRTMIKDENWKIVPPFQLTVTEAFINLVNYNWTNGSVVLTADRLVWSGNERGESDLPLYQLGKEAFELLDPFIPVHVPCYSEKEFHSCMDYYMERSWIQNENGNTEEGRSELMYLSTMNPYQLMKICGPL